MLDDFLKVFHLLLLSQGSSVFRGKRDVLNENQGLGDICLVDENCMDIMYCDDEYKCSITWWFILIIVLLIIIILMFMGCSLRCLTRRN